MLESAAATYSHFFKDGLEGLDCPDSCSGFALGTAQLDLAFHEVLSS